MGQQQILFLILGICVIGIAISTGVIALQQAEAPDNRVMIIGDLHQLAGEARSFFNRPMENGGGDGSFLLLTSTTNGIHRLTRPFSTTHGEFFVKKTGRASCVEIIGVGVQPGKDVHLPVRVSIVVWPDREEVHELN